MSKRNLCFLAATSIVATTCYASEQVADAYYARIDLGLNKAQELKSKNWEDTEYKDNLKGSFLVNIGVGQYITENFRADITLTTRNLKLNSSSVVKGSHLKKTQKIRATSLLMNLYYDIATFGAITPYLSAGVGYSQNKSGELLADFGSDGVAKYNKETSNNFAYQLGAGTALKLTQAFTVDFGYKFIDLGKVKTGNGIFNNNTPTSGFAAKLKAHEFTVGVRYDF